MLQSPLSVSMTQFLFGYYHYETVIQNMLLELPQYTACVYRRTRLCSTTQNVYALLSFETICEMSNIKALESFLKKLVSSILSDLPDPKEQIRGLYSATS
jgi:hypothetical protein